MNSKKIRYFLNILITLALACVGLLNILYKASISYDKSEITSFNFFHNTLFMRSSLEYFFYCFS